MLKLCSPTWLTQPPTTWPTSAGSMPVRARPAPAGRSASRSAGWTVDSPPPRRPTGVRTASTITTLVMAGAYGAHLLTVRATGHAGPMPGPDAPFVPLLLPARHARPSRARRWFWVQRRSRWPSATPAPERRLGPALPRHARHGGLLGASTCPTRPPAPADDAVRGPARGCGASVPETEWTVAGRAVQLVAWGRTHRFCGRCGDARRSPPPGDRAMRCPACGLLAYPRLAPAVIALVHRRTQTGRRGAAGPRRAVPAADVLVPGRLRGARARRSRRRCSARCGRRSACEVDDVRYQGSPAVAVPALADDRLLRPVGGGRHRASTRPRSRTPRWFRRDDAADHPARRSRSPAA